MNKKPPLIIEMERKISEIFNTSHKVEEFISLVKEVENQDKLLANENAKRIWREQSTKLIKKYKEELLPLAVFLELTQLKGTIKPELGNQNFDAILITDNRNTSIEITSAKDGHLRAKKLTIYTNMDALLIV